MFKLPSNPFDMDPSQDQRFQTEPAKSIVEDILKGKDVFLTGGGGVGKTYLTNIIKQHPFINAVTLATTGAAANLVGGMTIHRFFKLGLSNDINELRQWDKRNATNFGDRIGESPLKAHSILMNLIKKNLYGKNVIIIDEVSMASRKMIEMIFYRLRSSLKVDITLMYVGDFFQLPPVDPKGTKGMAFESELWDPNVYELTTIKRTENLDFARVQHKIRYGIADKEVLDYMADIQKNPYNEDTLHLFATNKEIDNHNIEKLRSLPGQPMKVKYRFNEARYKEEDAEKFIKDLMIQPTFYFKFGARVLFVTNHYDLDGNQVWYNGEMGTLEAFNEGAFTVLKDNGETVQVSRHTFVREDLEKGEVKVTMEIQQFPLRIAYAISIHKSQGMSLSRGHIDCSQFFLSEQFFVAISRFTDPKALSMIGFNKSMIQANEKALKYYEGCGMKSY